MLQACCKPVAGLFEASSFSLPPGPQTEHRSGPAYERPGVRQDPGIEYRPRKGRPGYRDLTDFKLACSTHSGLAQSAMVVLRSCAPRSEQPDFGVARPGVLPQPPRQQEAGGMRKALISLGPPAQR